MIWQSKATKFEKLLEKYSPALAAAFKQSMADLARGVDLKRLEAALIAGDTASAIAAMNLDEVAFVPFAEAFRTAFIAAGTAIIADTPTPKDMNGHDVVLRFNGRDFAAEEWLKQHAAVLVRDVVADQKVAIRQTLAAGLASGRNPADLVPELAGRLNRATGKREGGVIGMTAQQSSYADNAHAELTSGSASEVNAYLTRELRDRNFDAQIRAAFKEGEPLPDALVAKAVSAYRARLAAFRAKTLGLTETLTAMNRAEFVAFEQAINTGKVLEDNVIKVWRSAHDKRVRHTHSVLDGAQVKFREPFVSSSGARMMHPMDRSLGAGAREIVGCRCRVEYKIDFFAGVK